jgi:hypothetical protein
MFPTHQLRKEPAMKQLLLASAVALTAVLGLAPTADAKTKIGIFFGSPHYDYQRGPDYVYRDGYGWYEPSYRPAYSYNRGRLSCGEAKWHVRNSGYRNVSTIECRGRTYTFEAMRRGRDITIFVDSRTGRLSRG